MSENKPSRFEFEIDLALWNAVDSVEFAIKLGLRDKFVDQLSAGSRAKLFEGYVLKEHYETLEKKLWLAQQSKQITEIALDKASY